MEIDTMKAMLNTRDVARMYHVTSAAVLNWIRSGKLKAYTTPGGHYRVAREDLEAFSSAYSSPPEANLAAPGLRVLLVGADAALFDRLRGAVKFRWPTAQVEHACTEFEIGWWLARLGPTHIAVHAELTPTPLRDHCQRLAQAAEYASQLVELPGSLDDGLGEWIDRLGSKTPARHNARQ
jgi:excisionase family DNA binding protein